MRVAMAGEPGHVSHKRAWRLQEMIVIVIAFSMVMVIVIYIVIVISIFIPPGWDLPPHLTATQKRQTARSYLKCL